MKLKLSACDEDLRPDRFWLEHGYVRFKLAGKNTYLHRLVANRLPHIEKPLVDHINGDQLDCRRENLRWASHAENSRNQLHKSRGSSRFKGVYWASWANAWRAEITVDRLKIRLGYFKREEDAQRAYAIANIKHFGLFASPTVERSL